MLAFRSSASARRSRISASACASRPCVRPPLKIGTLTAPTTAKVDFASAGVNPISPTSALTRTDGSAEPTTAARVASGRSCQRLNVQVACDVDDEVTRALPREPRRLERVRLRSRVVDGFEIEDRLRDEDARVEHVERSDDIRDAGEGRTAGTAEA